MHSACAPLAHDRTMYNSSRLVETLRLQCTASIASASCAHFSSSKFSGRAGLAAGQGATTRHQIADRASDRGAGAQGMDHAYAYALPWLRALHGALHFNGFIVSFFTGFCTPCMLDVLASDMAPPLSALMR
jgi:hypothetical protein